MNNIELTRDELDKLLDEHGKRLLDSVGLSDPEAREDMERLREASRGLKHVKKTVFNILLTKATNLAIYILVAWLAMHFGFIPTPGPK